MLCAADDAPTAPPVATPARSRAGSTGGARAPGTSRRPKPSSTKLRRHAERAGRDRRERAPADERACRGPCGRMGPHLANTSRGPAPKVRMRRAPRGGPNSPSPCLDPRRDPMRQLPRRPVQQRAPPPEQRPPAPPGGEHRERRGGREHAPPPPSACALPPSLPAPVRVRPSPPHAARSRLAR